MTMVPEGMLWQVFAADRSIDMTVSGEALQPLYQECSRARHIKANRKFPEYRAYQVVPGRF